MLCRFMTLFTLRNCACALILTPALQRAPASLASAGQRLGAPLRRWGA